MTDQGLGWKEISICPCPEHRPRTVEVKVEEEAEPNYIGALATFLLLFVLVGLAMLILK